MSTNIDDAVRQQFSGNFIDAIDLMGRDSVEVEIESIVPPGAERDATGKVIDKTILRFKGKAKGLICNKTNLKIIAAQLGNVAHDWVGKRIRLTVRYLGNAFGQRNVPVVRVVPSESAPMTFGMRKNYGTAKPAGGE